MTMAQRRSLRDITMMDDEEQYFSKEKLLPERTKESFCAPPLSKTLLLSSRINRSGLFLLFLLSFVLFVFVIFVLHHFLTTAHDDESFGKKRTQSQQLGTRNSLFDDISINERRLKSHGEDSGDIIFSHLHDEDDHLFGFERSRSLNSRVEELHRIRSSVLAELRQLEKRRQELLESVGEETKKLDLLQNQVNREEKQLGNVQNAIEQANIAHREAVRREAPEIFLPLQLPQPPPTAGASNKHQAAWSKNLSSECTLEKCFDLSRCSIVNGLSVFLYRPDPGSSASARLGYEAASKGISATSRASDSCIFLVFLDSKLRVNTLSHWKEYGRNHLVLHFRNGSEGVSDGFKNSMAMMGDSEGTARRGFDFVIPPVLNVDWNPDSVWRELEPLLPVFRPYLLAFWGEYLSTGSVDTDKRVRELLVDNLNLIQETKTKDKFYFRLNCGNSKSDGNPGDWLLCGGSEDREGVLKHSKFSLILFNSKCLFNGGAAASYVALMRLQESLRCGSVPVILGLSAVLPFEEIIDWSLAVVRVPLQRITELHFILRSFSDADYVRMRQNGRQIFEKYLATVESVVKTVLAALRYRLFLPAVSNLASEYHGFPVFPGGEWNPPPTQTSEMPVVVDPEEYLGPVEPPFASPYFKHNFRLVGFFLFLFHPISIGGEANPFTEKFSSIPFDGSNIFQFGKKHLEPEPCRICLALVAWKKKSFLPTEAKFYEDTSLGFRPIGDGQGGSGKEFSKALGGNLPREQFTIVILTYERESVLASVLQRLNHLPYLNKIVVVWNSPSEPSADLIWPKLTSPVVFVRPGRNSLNNRFLPFSHIETEAVMSIDDDVYLTQAEIIFAFRVWREERDRIVGFPGRFHAWDDQHKAWLYNSNHSCELSMVLTGAAFFHKYYAFLYTYAMPSAIREKVDSVMNCEDLAMNFLVSHLTKKPPIKVTSKWTFRCPGCPETLSANEGHFLERHDCIQFFTKVYGYNPLLYTQYRVDSILFKTRIPHQHQKCFKFI